MEPFKTKEDEEVGKEPSVYGVLEQIIMELKRPRNANGAKTKQYGLTCDN